MDCEADINCYAQYYIGGNKDVYLIGNSDSVHNRYGGYGHGCINNTIEDNNGDHG